MFDVKALRQANDLLALLENDTTLKRVASTGGGEWAGPCPFCGGVDRFRVQPNADSGRWLCRTCTEGNWKDVIEYILRREKLTFVQACEFLAGRRDLSDRFRQAPRPPRAHVQPASAEWHMQALAAVSQCEDRLWAPVGRTARDWLGQRGLNDETLRRWRIGYNPTERIGRNICGLWVPSGIVIPGIVDGTVYYVKVRRSKAIHEAKYLQVKGGQSALFGAGNMAGQKVGVLTEGEFDAMLLHQFAGDLAGVATFGSATSTSLDAPGAMRLLAVPRLLLAFDEDAAGRQGAAQVAAKLARARVVHVPALGPKDKDLSDYYKAGGNLRAWLKFVMRPSCPNTPAPAGYVAMPTVSGKRYD